MDFGLRTAKSLLFARGFSKYFFKMGRLKVDGNEKRGGSGVEAINQILYAIVAIEGYFKFERAVSLLNSIFPFPVATAF